MNFFKNSDYKLFAEPYPFVEGKKFFLAPLYDELSRCFPKWQQIQGDATLKNNFRYDLEPNQTDIETSIVPTWLPIIKYFRSQAFFHDLLDVFGDELLDHYPGRFSSIEAMKQYRVGIRDVDTFENKDILMGFQFGCNSPVTETSAVRGMHLDRANKLFAGFGYFRQPEDETSGGNFGIFNNDTGELKEIPYEPNHFVVFLNTRKSFHSVTAREKTPHARLFVNFIVMVSEDLF